MAGRDQAARGSREGRGWPGSKDRAPQVQAGEGTAVGDGLRAEAAGHQPVPSTGRDVLGRVWGRGTQSQASRWALGVTHVEADTPVQEAMGQPRASTEVPHSPGPWAGSCPSSTGTLCGPLGTGKVRKGIPERTSHKTRGQGISDSEDKATLGVRRGHPI